MRVASTPWSNAPRSRYSSSRFRTSFSVKPSRSLNLGLRLTFVPLLKPLVTSSIVMGETPVTNSRSRPPPLSPAPAFSVAKKLR